MSVSIKSEYFGDIRRFNIALGDPLENLKQMLRRIYDLKDAHFEVTFRNQDGDWAAIHTDAEMWRAFESHPGIPRISLRTVEKVAVPPIPVTTTTTSTSTTSHMVREEEERPIFTQVPLQQQVLQQATSFETVLQNSLLELFKRTDFQEKILELVKETITSSAFSNIVQSLLPQVQSAATQSEIEKDEQILLDEAIKEVPLESEEVEEAEIVVEPVSVNEVTIIEEEKEEEVIPEKPKEELKPEEPTVEAVEKKVEETVDISETLPIDVKEEKVEDIPSMVDIVEIKPEPKEEKKESPKSPKKALLPTIFSALGLGASEPKPKPDYSAQLKTLEEMGFTDRENNLRLLEKHKGSVEQVLERLFH